MGMASPGAVSSETPRAWAVAATADVAPAATRPAVRPERHTVGVEAERTVVVAVGVMVAVIAGSLRARDPPDRHLLQKKLRAPEKSRKVRRSAEGQRHEPERGALVVGADGRVVGPH